LARFDGLHDQGDWKAKGNRSREDETW